MSEPVAFMVMPFNKKPTLSARDDVPSEVDFDALWHRVHQPLLEELGYRAVRADSDVGALVVVEMIRRLAFADIVVADVSLPNSNVYYEIGVRHAAQEHGCVLVAATWAEPVFDLDQMRRLAYPLSDGACGEAAAEAAKAVLREQLDALVKGSSPVFQAIPGYPGQVDRARLAAFAGTVDALSSFETDVGAIRLTLDKDLRKQKTRELVDRHGAKPVVRQSVVLELIALIRDNLGWTDVLAYVNSLPPTLQQHPSVAEQRQLALAKTGNVAESAAALQQLIERSGATSERFGLLGGRYKELMWQAPAPTSRHKFLEKAIDAYERGMALDLNDYYPSSNLPRLYRLRRREGDEKRAVDVATVAMVACRASMARNLDDEWARPTLLGAAFDSGDVEQARELVEQIRQEDITPWKVESTIKDLAHSLSLHEQPEVRTELDKLLTAVREMAGE